MSRAFDIAYEGTPTWDIGRPQPAVVRLAEAGAFTGSVIDVGCGTGEHVAYLAGRGHDVIGVDIAERAVARARAKLDERDLRARVVVGDALALEGLGTFDTALDVGLFHVLQPDDRRRYARELASVVRGGGRAFVLCWSARNPFGYGPERITRTMLRRSFVVATGWRIESIEPETLETLLPERRVHAWLAIVRRLG